MITVSIYNKCETELNSTEGFTEEFKLFKIKYSKNLFSLAFKTPSEITKKFVDSLVEPDFECVSADFDDSCDRLVLNFEKAKPKAATQPVCSQTDEPEQPVVVEVEENKAESPENQPVIGEEETQSVEQPKPKKPRARRRTKAEMEAARAENAKRLAGIS
jgi:hypothetical protein